MSLSSENKPAIVGILNVTPDSFSDGGTFTKIESAVEHAITMAEQGAEIIDVGGESTRPGSERVGAKEQISRVVDVIQACRERIPQSVRISIDTTRAEVARVALEAGAGIINDVAAGRDDPDMLALVSDKQVPYIIMHMLGQPKTMQDEPHYDDVSFEVKQFLLKRAEACIHAGIHESNLILDPGIGFGKTREHNLQLIAELKELVDTGFPVLLGASRKRFMGAICQETEPKNLVSSTCATTALGVMAGVKYFRVHDVRENVQAAAVAWAVKNS